MRNFFVTAAVGTMLACLTGTAANAAIVSQSENFNDGNYADDAALVADGYTFDSSLTGIATGGNINGAGGLDGSQPQNDPDGGDGVNDGGIFIDGNPQSESVTYTFPGTIADGEDYMFDINLFQSSSSFVIADVELLANGVVVASVIGQGGINGREDLGNPGTELNPAKLVQLSYTGDATTDGQSLAFRARQERGSNNSMDVGIDNWSLNVTPVPEPATLALTLLGLCGLGIRRRR